MDLYPRNIIIGASWLIVRISQPMGKIFYWISTFTNKVISPEIVAKELTANMNVFRIKHRELQNFLASDSHTKNTIISSSYEIFLYLRVVTEMNNRNYYNKTWERMDVRYYVWDFKGICRNSYEPWLAISASVFIHPWF